LIVSSGTNKAIKLSIWLSADFNFSIKFCKVLGRFPDLVMIRMLIKYYPSV
jgi:hypothetical protein